MNKQLKQTILPIAGIILIIIGIIGLILPILQGLLFIGIGLFLIGVINKKTLKKWKKKITKNFS